MSDHADHVDGDPAAAPEAAALPARLFGPDQVDVAYEPWRVLNPTSLRAGPSPRAEAVVADGGGPVVLAPGQYFARQSTRNPNCSEAPPLRPATAGFVWGYGIRPVTAKSGWLALADLDRDGDAAITACGPAGADFDRRRPGSCGGHCDGRPLSGVRRVRGTAAVRSREVYLRYAPGSTAFRYLLAGDEVRRLAVWRMWTGISVRRARWAAPGARGWVLTNTLVST